MELGTAVLAGSWSQPGYSPLPIYTQDTPRYPGIHQDTPTQYMLSAVGGTRTSIPLDEALGSNGYPIVLVSVSSAQSCSFLSGSMGGSTQSCRCELGRKCERLDAERVSQVLIAQGRLSAQGHYSLIFSLHSLGFILTYQRLNGRTVPGTAGIRPDNSVRHAPRHGRPL